jgi:hypothetical protein
MVKVRQKLDLGKARLNYNLERECNLLVESKGRTTSSTKSYRKKWLPLVRSMAVFSLHDAKNDH